MTIQTNGWSKTFKVKITKKKGIIASYSVIRLDQIPKK